MSGLFGDIPLRTQFEHVLIRGFAQFDAATTFNKVVVPVTATLLDFVLMPFFLSRLVGMKLQSYQMRTLAARYSIHGYIALLALWKGLRATWTYVNSLHNEIRDSRYLIGTKLSNRN